jgi:hypothetical protein
VVSETNEKFAHKNIGKKLGYNQAVVAFYGKMGGVLPQIAIRFAIKRRR